MKGYHPKILAFVVYKNGNNDYRAFCDPYDVSCKAKTKQEALRKLEKLVKLYDEGLKKYGYPKHLSIRRLSDSKDELVFEKVKKRIISDIERNFRRFQAEKQRETFRIKGVMNPSGYYLSPALV